MTEDSTRSSPTARASATNPGKDVATLAVSRTAIALVGHEVTVDDGKARRELGYQGKVSIEAGLAQMTAR